jgi:hypothetical protein
MSDVVGFSMNMMSSPRPQWLFAYALALPCLILVAAKRRGFEGNRLDDTGGKVAKVTYSKIFLNENDV